MIKESDKFSEDFIGKMKTYNSITSGVFVEKKVWMKDELGRKVCGILSKPKVKNVFLPIVLLVHGFTSDKYSKTYVSLANDLAKKGIASLRIDFFGHGESQGNFSDITITNALKSVRAALDYINELGFVDKNRIGIAGASLGGELSNISSSKFKEISCTALLCSVSSYIEIFKKGFRGINVSEWKKKGYAEIIRKRNNAKLRLNYSFYKDTIKYDGYKYGAKIKYPVLLVHGDNDISVDISQSKRLVKTFKEKHKFVILKGVDHYFRPESSRKVVYKHVVDWFSGNL
ncbi:esterase [Candidatus Venteria ishoeyi]|uniref:Esterase n=1 Tax=Candidatus Venteria ishoeyi TaxID=1899563 RepID=A0A1H6F7Y1_9GAMM|nr:esterase [Candidatus Venteria ishoeyi]